MNSGIEYNEDFNNQDPTNNKKFSLDEINKSYDDLDVSTLELQETLLRSTQAVGYMREQNQHSRNILVEMCKYQDVEPLLIPIIASGIEHADITSQFILNSQDHEDNLYKSLSDLSASSDLITNTSGSTMELFIPDFKEKFDIKFPELFPLQNSEIIEKLELIEPSLSKTYNEIVQVIYGTTADPVRAALSLMRQVFDHFFSIFAPDDEVLKSSFWSPKKGTDPNQIYRQERVRFAINNHIKNKISVKLLENDITQILANYNVLNKFHTRDGISNEQAKESLLSVKKFIDEFVRNLTTD